MYYISDGLSKNFDLFSGAASLVYCSMVHTQVRSKEFISSKDEAMGDDDSNPFTECSQENEKDAVLSRY